MIANSQHFLRLDLPILNLTRLILNCLDLTPDPELKQGLDQS